MRRRLLTTFLCPDCLKRIRLLGWVRRAHPPLCWHKDRSRWGDAPMTMTEVTR